MRVVYFPKKQASHFITMRFTILVAALLPRFAECVNIVLSNDDGWAEINIRSFYNALTAVGDSVVLSAPAENKSGTGATLPHHLTTPC